MPTARIFRLWVIIMISALCNLLGLQANAASPVTAYARQVDLSGNIFSFSMPENFSKDMPAKDMVEKLDIRDLSKFDDPEYGNIVRRWWDIKKAGFFGKQLGTLMMDVSVQRVPENQQKLLHDQPYDIRDRLDFMMMIYDQSHQRYDQLNLETTAAGETNAYHFGCCSLLGDEIRSHYRDYIYNHQKWIGYSIAAPLNQLIVGLVMPVSEQTYVEVIFTYSPNHGVLPMEFLDIATKLTKPIEESFYVTFADGNSMKKIVGDDWVGETNNEVFAFHRDAILAPLFGPDIQDRIKDGKKKALEVQKAWEPPLND